MNKRLSKYAHSHEQYTVTELDSKDFSSRITNKDGRVVWLVVDPPPYAGMLSHAPNSHGIVEVVVCAFTFHRVPSLVSLGCLPLSVLEALSDPWLVEDTQCCVYRGQALEKVSYQHALC